MYSLKDFGGGMRGSGAGQSVHLFGMPQRSIEWTSTGTPHFGGSVQIIGSGPMRPP